MEMPSLSAPLILNVGMVNRATMAMIQSRIDRRVSRNRESQCWRSRRMTTSP